MNPILWTDHARDQLADIYVATPAEERDEFANAIVRLEAQLALQGETAGESREGNRRVLFFSPVVVFFDLLPHALRICAIRSIRPRGRD